MFPIDSKMSLLQIVESNPLTEEVFCQYEEELGSCLLCNNLFDSLEVVAEVYQLDINEMLSRLRLAEDVSQGKINE